MLEFAVLAHGGGLAVAFDLIAGNAEGRDRALRQKAAQFLTQLHRAFQVQSGAIPPLIGGAADRLRRHIDREAAGRLVDHGEADARAGDRGAEVDGCDVEGGGDRDARGVAFVKRAPRWRKQIEREIRRFTASDACC